PLPGSSIGRHSPVPRSFASRSPLPASPPAPANRSRSHASRRLRDKGSAGGGLGRPPASTGASLALSCPSFCRPGTVHFSSIEWPLAAAPSHLARRRSAALGRKAPQCFFCLGGPNFKAPGRRGGCPGSHHGGGPGNGWIT